MPRLNLSITQELYDSLEKAAENNNTTINMLVLNVLESMYAEKVTYDYSIALQSLIEESKEMKSEFTLSSRPTNSKVALTLRRISTLGVSITSNAKATFSKTVRCGSNLKS